MVFCDKIKKIPKLFVWACNICVLKHIVVTSYVCRAVIYIMCDKQTY